MNKKIVSIAGQPKLMTEAERLLTKVTIQKIEALNDYREKGIQFAQLYLLMRSEQGKTEILGTAIKHGLSIEEVMLPTILLNQKGSISSNDLIISASELFKVLGSNEMVKKLSEEGFDFDLFQSVDLLKNSIITLKDSDTKSPFVFKDIWPKVVAKLISSCTDETEARSLFGSVVDVNSLDDPDNTGEEPFSFNLLDIIKKSTLEDQSYITKIFILWQTDFVRGLLKVDEPETNNERLQGLASVVSGIFFGLSDKHALDVFKILESLPNKSDIFQNILNQTSAEFQFRPASMLVDHLIEKDAQAKKKHPEQVLSAIAKLVDSIERDEEAIKLLGYIDGKGLQGFNVLSFGELMDPQFQTRATKYYLSKQISSNKTPLSDLDVLKNTPSKEKAKLAVLIYKLRMHEISTLSDAELSEKTRLARLKKLAVSLLGSIDDVAIKRQVAVALVKATIDHSLDDEALKILNKTNRLALNNIEDVFAVKDAPFFINDDWAAIAAVLLITVENDKDIKDLLADILKIEKILSREKKLIQENDSDIERMEVFAKSISDQAGAKVRTPSSDAIIYICDNLGDKLPQVIQAYAELQLLALSKSQNIAGHKLTAIETTVGKELDRVAYVLASLFKFMPISEMDATHILTNMIHLFDKENLLKQDNNHPFNVFIYSVAMNYYWLYTHTIFSDEESDIKTSVGKLPSLASEITKALLIGQKTQYFNVINLLTEHTLKRGAVLAKKFDESELIKVRHLLSSEINPGNPLDTSEYLYFRPEANEAGIKALSFSDLLTNNLIHAFQVNLQIQAVVPKVVATCISEALTLPALEDNINRNAGVYAINANNRLELEALIKKKPNEKTLPSTKKEVVPQTSSNGKGLDLGLPTGPRSVLNYSVTPTKLTTSPPMGAILNNPNTQAKTLTRDDLLPQSILFTISSILPNIDLIFQKIIPDHLIPPMIDAIVSGIRRANIVAKDNRSRILVVLSELLAERLADPTVNKMAFYDVESRISDNDSDAIREELKKNGILDDSYAITNKIDFRSNPIDLQLSLKYRNNQDHVINVLRGKLSVILGDNFPRFVDQLNKIVSTPYSIDDEIKDILNFDSDPFNIAINLLELFNRVDDLQSRNIILRAIRVQLRKIESDQLPVFMEKFVNISFPILDKMFVDLIKSLEIENKSMIPLLTQGLFHFIQKFSNIEEGLSQLIVEILETLINKDNAAMAIVEYITKYNRENSKNGVSIHNKVLVAQLDLKLTKLPPDQKQIILDIFKTLPGVEKKFIKKKEAPAIGTPR